MKSAAVVGANGFIGSALLKGLSEHAYHPLAITRNREIKNCFADVIFYMAGSSKPNNVSNEQVDLQSLIEFLDRLKDSNTRPLLVFASSAGTIYNPREPQPYNESSLLSPTNAYGQAKLNQENVIKQASWVDSLILRLSNIYGPHQKAKPGFGVIATWAQKICDNEPIEIMGNSERDYLNIFDLVDVALKIMKSNKSRFAGQTVNLGSGKTTSLNDLYKIFFKLSKQKINVIRKPARTFDTNSVSLDVSLAKELFDWEPKINLDLGIKNVLETTLQRQLTE